MKICIPSKDRSDTMSTHLFFNPKDVLIFVEPQEIKKYKIFHPDYTFINIEQNNKGVSYARNYILNYVGDENIIMADDDYEFFGKRNNDGRYDRLKNCQEIVDTIEQTLNDYIGCGICNDVFSYFLNKNNKNQRLYINKESLMDFYGINMKWLNAKNIRFDENLKEHEDHDFTIMILVNGGKICNDYSYCRHTLFQNSGGLANERGGCINQDQILRRILKYSTQKYGAEFIKTKHDSSGYLKEYTLNFKLIFQRLDIIKTQIKKYNDEHEK